MSEQSESLVPAARAGVVLATWVVMGLLLSACGQKGPLTLVSTSKPSAAKVTASVAVTPAAPVAAPASAPPPRTWGSPPP